MKGPLQCCSTAYMLHALHQNHQPQTCRQCLATNKDAANAHIKQSTGKFAISQYALHCSSSASGCVTLTNLELREMPACTSTMDERLSWMKSVDTTWSSVTPKMPCKVLHECHNRLKCHDSLECHNSLECNNRLMCQQSQQS